MVWGMVRSHRTANRQSASFQIRMFLRRTRARILVGLIRLLDDTRAAA